jgi:hypothetical protein
MGISIRRQGSTISAKDILKMMTRQAQRVNGMVGRHRDNGVLKPGGTMTESEAGRYHRDETPGSGAMRQD